MEPIIFAVMREKGAALRDICVLRGFDEARFSVAMRRFVGGDYRLLYTVRKMFHLSCLFRLRTDLVSW